MKSTEFDESKYLNAKSAGKLNGTTQTIYDVKAEMVGQDDNKKRKMIISLEGQEKTIVVNKTNREILTEAYGEETDDWRGKQVILHLVSVTFKGERTLSIQLEPVTRTKPGIQEDAERITREGEFVPLDKAAEELGINHTTSPPLGSAEEHTSGKKRKR